MDFGRQKIDIDIAWKFINNAKVSFNQGASIWFLDLCNPKQKLNGLRHQATNWHKILHHLDKEKFPEYLSKIIYNFLKAKVSLKICENFQNKPKVFQELLTECKGVSYRDGFEYLYEKQLDKDTFTYHYMQSLRIMNYEYER